MTEDTSSPSSGERSSEPSSPDTPADAGSPSAAPSPEASAPTSSDPTPSGPPPGGPAGAAPPPYGGGHQPPPPPPYGYYPPPPPQPRSRLGLLLGLGVVGVVAACCVFSMMASVVNPQAGGLAGGGPVRLVERVVVEGEGLQKLVLVEVTGPIAREVTSGGLLALPGPDMVERIRAELKQAAEDDQALGVLLRIDSPGGTVSASDEIWHLVEEFKRESRKPVVVHMGAVCASGGYYIAVAGDQIWCEPTTITGSIGVVLSALNFNELLEEYGVKDVTLTSGANKDLLNPLAPIRESHLAILQEMIDETHERFVTIVAEGRGLELDEVRPLADGRIFTANLAHDKGLVDKIGYRDEALAALAQRVGMGPEPRVVRYSPPPSLADVLAGNVASLGGEPRAGVTVQLDPQLLDRLSTPRLLALWRPR